MLVGPDGQVWGPPKPNNGIKNSRPCIRGNGTSKADVGIRWTARSADPSGLAAVLLFAF